MQSQNSSISNFKSFLLKFLLPFLLSFLIAGYIFQYIFERKVILKSEINGAYKVNRIINSSDTNEIPMFGSSRMEGSIIPDMLGSHYFNYGLSGTQDDVVMFFTSEECNKKKHGPILINFDLDGLNHSLGDIANYIYNINNANVRSLVGRDDQWYFHIPFIKYYGRYEEYYKDYLTNRVTLTKFTSKGASIEKNALIPEKFAELVRERTKTKQTFINDSDLLHRLVTILNTHQERKFIFIIAPYHPSYFANYNNQAEAYKFLDYLSKFKNVSVLDYSKADYADSLFFNTEHLNYQGAKIFSRSLHDTLSHLKPAI